MRPPFGHEAASYIRAAKPIDPELPSIIVDTSELDYDDEEPTQPYTPLRRKQLELVSDDDDTLPSAAFEPEPSPWKGAVTGFTHSWGISLVAAAIIMALAFEYTCNR